MRTRPPSGARYDGGAGTVATIGIVGFTVGLAALTLPISTVSNARHLASTAADAAALAAADVLVGVSVAAGVAGDGGWAGACGAAVAVVTANGARLGACTIDELVVTVRAEATTAFGVISATASAGPPG